MVNGNGIAVNGTKHSRMVQVKYVEHFHNSVFYKVYLVHS